MTPMKCTSVNLLYYLEKTQYGMVCVQSLLIDKLLPRFPNLTSCFPASLVLLGAVPKIDVTPMAATDLLHRVF